MAQSLLDIRQEEARRGPTLVFAHNLHLRRSRSSMRVGQTVVDWYGAGAVVAALTGERYAFVAGSLGRSEAIALGEPDPDTYEGFLQRRVPDWALAPAAEIPPARTRTDTTPRQGYFPSTGRPSTTPTRSAHQRVGRAREGNHKGGPVVFFSGPATLCITCDLPTDPYRSPENPCRPERRDPAD